jgi:hypothetical protein
MLRLMVDATTDPADIHADMLAHQQDMIRRCPYLGPSVERGLTVWSSYDAEPGDSADLFAMLVTSAERLRQDRREHGPLVCKNLAIFGPTDISSAQRLLDWPAWLARNLYAPVQMMVGRFWTGAQLDDSKGEAMMPPPVSFFSMRHSIPSKDGLFLSAKLPEIMAILETGPGDDGRDVFAAPFGRRVDNPASVYHELAKVFPNPHTEDVYTGG